MISTSSTSSSKDEPIKIIDKNYFIFTNKQLGKGGFGQIFLGKNIKQNSYIAVKVEDQNSKSHLPLEYSILKDIQDNEGIPKIYKLIETKKHNYLIMDYLGKSIDKLFTNCNKKFSLKTVCEIGYQMVQRIEYVHSKGYIHRDIKPGNFVLGRNENKAKLFIIDFGLAKKYIDENGKHISYKDGKGMTGTARYVSLFTHYGIEQSRRDDIEGIAYNLIYFIKGKLPWQGVKAVNKKEKYQKIMEQKQLYEPDLLCKGLSEEFPTLLKYARKLDFDEKPDYKNIKIMFKQLIVSNGMKFDWKYDWDLIGTSVNESCVSEKKEEKKNDKNVIKNKGNIMSSDIYEDKYK